MYKVLFIIAGFLIFSQTCRSQANKKIKVKQLVAQTKKINFEKYSFDLEYSEKKSTFNITKFKNGVKMEVYKLIDEDIHPEGIFLIESEKGITIRFLSNCHYEVFVIERFIDGRLLIGSSSNIIDITDLPILAKNDLETFVSLFKEVLKKEKQVPTIVEPPRTKN